MGVLVDLTQRLTITRRFRGLLRESHCRSILQTRRYIEALEAEIDRQEIVLCNPFTSMTQVEEAIEGLELLGGLLSQRRYYLAELEADYGASRVN